MDPLACWERLVEACRMGEMEEAAQAAMDLRQWQVGGGFMPAGVPDSVGCRLRDFALVARAVARCGV